MPVDRLTIEHLQELESLVARGDRGGFYHRYWQLSGTEQAIIQAQITTYSGAWGGTAILGNVAAKQAAPDKYTISLDTFSSMIVAASYAAIRGNRGRTTFCASSAHPTGR